MQMLAQDFGQIGVLQREWAIESELGREFSRLNLFADRLRDWPHERFWRFDHNQMEVAGSDPGARSDSWFLRGRIEVE